MALRYRVLAAVAVVVPLALVTACSGAAGPFVPAAQAAPGGGIPAAPAPGPQALSETGSTLLFPLLDHWAAGYHQQHANVSITTAATGSGKGIADASAGTVDIGASDAYLSSGNLVSNPALLNIPLAISAQQVNYNVPGLRPGTHLKLSGKVLAEMYQGTITTWNDPQIASAQPGRDAAAARRWCRCTGRTAPATPSCSPATCPPRIRPGTTTRATARRCPGRASPGRAPRAGTRAWWPAARPRRAASPTSASPTCPRPWPRAWATRSCENTLGAYELPTATSIGAAVGSFVSSTPTNETISMVNGPAASGYPIVNYEYAVVTTRQPDAAKARDIKAFLHWAITAGQRPAVPEPGAVPAAAAVHRVALRRADREDRLAVTTTTQPTAPPAACRRPPARRRARRRRRSPAPRRPGCGLLMVGLPGIAVAGLGRGGSLDGDPARLRGARRGRPPASRSAWAHSGCTCPCPTPTSPRRRRSWPGPNEPLAHAQRYAADIAGAAADLTSLRNAADDAGESTARQQPGGGLGRPAGLHRLRGAGRRPRSCSATG